MILAITAPQVSAVAAVVTSAVAIITGTVAIFSFLGLRRDSRDRSRPVMTAELRPRLLSHGMSELAIRNAGQSVARNVAVTFDPPLNGPEEINGTPTMLSFLKNRYEKTMPTIAPGMELTNIYGITKGDGSRDLKEPAPYDVTVAITYSDEHGRAYSSTYELTIDIMRNATVSNPSNEDERGMRRRWANALETIARGVGRP